MKGKLSYLAPEVTFGRPNTPQSDLFGVGNILWETLAGERLFDGKNDIEIFKQIRACKVPPIRERRPDVPPALAAVLDVALAADPAKRYAAATEFASALSQVMKQAVGVDPRAHSAQRARGARCAAMGATTRAATIRLRDRSNAPPAAAARKKRESVDVEFSTAEVGARSDRAHAEEEVRAAPGSLLIRALAARRYRGRTIAASTVRKSGPDELLLDVELVDGLAEIEQWAKLEAIARANDHVFSCDALIIAPAPGAIVAPAGVEFFGYDFGRYDDEHSRFSSIRHEAMGAIRSFGPPDSIASDRLRRLRMSHAYAATREAMRREGRDVEQGGSEQYAITIFGAVTPKKK